MRWLNANATNQKESCAPSGVMLQASVEAAQDVLHESSKVHACLPSDRQLQIIAAGRHREVQQHLGVWLSRALLPSFCSVDHGSGAAALHKYMHLLCTECLKTKKGTGQEHNSSSSYRAVLYYFFSNRLHNHLLLSRCLFQNISHDALGTPLHLLCTTVWIISQWLNANLCNKAALCAECIHPSKCSAQFGMRNRCNLSNKAALLAKQTLHSSSTLVLTSPSVGLVKFLT